MRRLMNAVSDFFWGDWFSVSVGGTIGTAGIVGGWHDADAVQIAFGSLALLSACLLIICNIAKRRLRLAMARIEAIENRELA